MHEIMMTTTTTTKMMMMTTTTTTTTKLMMMTTTTTTTMKMKIVVKLLCPFRKKCNYQSTHVKMIVGWKEFLDKNIVICTRFMDLSEALVGLPHDLQSISPIARFMGPTWGPSGADRTQVDPMLTPWTLLSEIWPIFVSLLFPTSTS